MKSFIKIDKNVILWLFILVFGLFFCIKITSNIAEKASEILDYRSPGVELYWQHTFQIIGILIIFLCLFYCWKYKIKYLKVLFFALLFFIFDYFYSGYDVFEKYYFSFCYFSLAIFILFLGITKRIFASFFFTAFLLAFLYLVSIIKERFLEMPLGLGDFYIFFQNASANIELVFVYPWIAILIVLIILVCILSAWLFIKFEKPLIKGETIHVVVIQTLLATSALSSLYFYRPLTDFGQIKGTLSINNIVGYLDFLTVRQTIFPHIKYDPVLKIITFVHYKNLVLDLPPPTTSVKYSGVFQQDSNYKAGNKRPDIMMVLAESGFDPTLVGACVEPACNRHGYVPDFSGRSEQNLLQVHIFGGRTWLSEFAFITGFDYRFFRASGVLAPLVVAPKLKASLVTHLKSLGYRTVAVYPIDGNFLDARNIYKKYGFDEFYSLPEFYKKQEKHFLPIQFTDWEKITDSEVYNRALDFIKINDNKKPLFVFVLTIRNHSPWKGGMTLDLGLYNSPDAPLTDYAAKLHDTDVAFANLAKMWLASESPRILGWFGDHQPHISSLLPITGRSIDSRIPKQYRDYLQYFTYYGFFANYSDGVTEADLYATDIAFLGFKLLKFAGLPIPRDLNGADVVIKECSGGLFNCRNKELVDAYVSKRIYQDSIIEH